MKKGIILLIVILLASYCGARNFMVQSFDGQLISYNVFGSGDVTLVFVHGWAGDSRYWKNQIPYFSKKYTVVVIDSAGQGHSEQTRDVYTLEAFGKDVKAVVDDINATKVILIGHSMGDGVIGEAAKLMPEKVIGLIGVDTLQSVEGKMPQEEVNKILEGMKKDFKAEVKTFIEPMLGKNIKPELRKWIIDDICCQNPRVGISAVEEYIDSYNNLRVANTYRQIKVPVRAVNADLWPTSPEVNRKYMASFEVTIMKGCGHFPMMERPEEFNKHLHKYVKELINLSKAKK
jgi:pimeloyl-ACP methyl ester carboxylesterase